MRRDAITFRLDADKKKALDAIAAGLDRDRSYVLNEALEIHLCYIYGSIVPRVFEETYGDYVSASLRTSFREHITRSVYVSLLRLDPIRGHWGDSSRPGSPVNLSQPLPAAVDDR